MRMINWDASLDSIQCNEAWAMTGAEIWARFCTLYSVEHSLKAINHHAVGSAELAHAWNNAENAWGINLNSLS